MMTAYEKLMKYHRDRHRKPFEIGQLVRPRGARMKVVYLVLDLEWSSRTERWSIHLLSQRTGRKMWCSSHEYVAMRKADD